MALDTQVLAVVQHVTDALRPTSGHPAQVVEAVLECALTDALRAHSDADPDLVLETLLTLRDATAHAGTAASGNAGRTAGQTKGRR